MEDQDNRRTLSTTLQMHPWSVECFYRVEKPKDPGNKEEKRTKVAEDDRQKHQAVQRS